MRRSINGVNQLGMMDSAKSLDVTRLGSDVAAMPIYTRQTCLLRRIDPARNMARFYRLSLEPSLFGDVALVREWGRIGGLGRTRVDLFRIPDEAHAAFTAIEASKRRRGYLDQPGHLPDGENAHVAG